MTSSLKHSDFLHFLQFSGHFFLVFCCWIAFLFHEYSLNWMFHVWVILWRFALCRLCIAWILYPSSLKSLNTGSLNSGSFSIGSFFYQFYIVTICARSLSLSQWQCNKEFRKNAFDRKFNSFDIVSDNVSGLQVIDHQASKLLLSPGFENIFLQEHIAPGVLCKQLHAMKNLNCNNRLLHASIGSKWKPIFGSLIH